MKDQTVKVRICILKNMDGVELLQDQSSQVYSWNIHLSISKLTGKTEYAKHVVRNITFSKAAGDDNITGQTASAQVLFYLNVHLFATIVSIQGMWEVGVGGIHPPPPPQCLNFKKCYEMDKCTRDITCAMMTVNNAIDCKMTGV